MFHWLTRDSDEDLPSVESYAKKVQMTELDLDMAGSEEERRQLEEKRTSYIWRGLRLASKQQLGSFDRLEHGKGLGLGVEALQPVSSNEAAGEDNAQTGPEDRDMVPQEEDQSVEDQRADQQSQVAADSAAAE